MEGILEAWAAIPLVSREYPGSSQELGFDVALGVAVLTVLSLLHCERQRSDC